MTIYKKTYTMVPVDPRTGKLIGLRGTYTSCGGMAVGAAQPPIGLSGSGVRDADGEWEANHTTRYGTEVIRPPTIYEDEFEGMPDGNASLAIGVSYLLLGRALLDFPTTNRAAPSRYVQVSLGTKGPLIGREQDKGRFPMLVAWDIWESAVVPVLRADDNQRSYPKNAILISQGQYLEFFRYIHGKLILSFQEQGLIP
jgi:hypothetical protein